MNQIFIGYESRRPYNPKPIVASTNSDFVTEYMHSKFVSPYVENFVEANSLLNNVDCVYFTNYCITGIEDPCFDKFEGPYGSRIELYNKSEIWKRYLDIANDYETFGYSWRLVSDNRIAGDIHEHWSFQDDLAFMNDRAGFDKAFDIRVVRLHVFRAMEGVIPV